MALQTHLTTRYSAFGNARFYITYEDTTWRVSSLRIDNDASVPAQLKVWLNQTPEAPVIDYIAQPGADQSLSIPPGQDYLMTEYNFSFNFISS